MKNAFCKRLKQRKHLEEAAIKTLTMQLMWDSISIALNNNIIITFSKYLVNSFVEKKSHFFKTFNKLLKFHS